MLFKLTNANFPKTADGRVYHVGTKRGEVANRIITVGDPNRARVFANFLDKNFPQHIQQSHRGFLTITGRYKGVPVSIVAIGMGVAMMDLFVREVRAVVDGTLAIIRVGSCGTIGTAQTGTMVVPRGAFAVSRNYDHFANDDELDSVHYHLSKVFDADPEMCQLLHGELCQTLPPSDVYTGLNATCDSFYSSQGRQDDNFHDANQDLIKFITTTYPDVQSLEMETFMLFHLAKMSTTASLKFSRPGIKNSIRAAASTMVFTNRISNDFIAPEQVNFLEEVAGQAVLNALVRVKLDEVHEENGSVWDASLTQLGSGDDVL